MSAFDNCENLTSVTIGEGLASIAEYSFRNCHQLTSVVIPKSLSKVAAYAFYSCYNIKSVYYGGEATEWNTINIGSDNNTFTRALRYYYSNTEPAVIGNFWYYDSDGNVLVWS